MEAALDKLRNVTIDGRRTSLRLAPEYWSALDEIVRRERFLLHDLCAFVRRQYPERSLASAVRVFVTCYFHDLVHHGVAADAPSHLAASVVAAQAAPGVG